MARALAVFGLLLLAPGTAYAHVGHVILRAERYLKLDVSGRSARMVVSLTLGAEEGERVLRATDADGDGDVTSAEADAYLAQWTTALRDELPLALDGEPLVVPWADGYLAPIGRVRRAPLTIEAVARFELHGGEETVRFEDRMVRREVFDRTDVAFDVRDGAELLGSGVEGEAETPTPDLSYGGTFHEGEPIALVATVRTPAPPPEPADHRWAYGAAAGIALALLVGGWLLRARRAR